MSGPPRGAPRAGSNGQAGGGGDCVKKYKCLVTSGAVGLAHSHCNGVASRGSAASAVATGVAGDGGGFGAGGGGGPGGGAAGTATSSGKAPASWLRVHLYKLLLVLVVALILLQYAFSSIFEAHQLEPLFAINASAGAVAAMAAFRMPGAARHPGTAHYPFVDPAGPQPPPQQQQQTATALDGDASASGSANASDAAATEGTGDATAGLLLSPDTGLEPSGGGRRCPLVPPDLDGPYCVKTDAPPLEQLGQHFPQLEVGGAWRPKSCRSRSRVAVIIPYRDRAHHLSVLLFNLHPFLQRQQLDYRIVIVEQAGLGSFPKRFLSLQIIPQVRSKFRRNSTIEEKKGKKKKKKRIMRRRWLKYSRLGVSWKAGSTPFNRAMLMNIGFVEALKLYDFECFIFHDVDLLPEDDRNLYSCPEQPRHMSVAVDVFKYRLPYPDLFGGVSAMTKEQFQRVNGFSNMFWGWGGEDDDMANRLKFRGFHIARYPANIARYKMLTHRKQRANPKRYEMLYTGRKRFKTDGLNSLRYVRKELNLYHTYTRVLVELVSPS